ncbi:MAG: DUF962 domain-containing protein [Lutibacter sp.]|uniref:DUF962 domain-containing protein n=1 Tax=Lutibacter sp. TaxID=1925666 RepID=UPI00179C1CFE|nr:DUF962 domain-containing protein [Lutibacter sp.]MBT8317376.1 DUF962 domain-containing protein [Lutibacter sp.]NNJ58235.1 DUF962 domain-containing protein [Lutibacter sp.]
MENQLKSFEEFYPFYLKEHSNKICRLLHVIGTTFVLALFLTAVIHLNPYWLIFIPITGYGFAWVGHYFFEKNRPATFKYPLWSLKSDFKMYYEIVTGKISLDSSKD